MKMLFIIYPLLMLKFGCCAEDFKFGIKTVADGQNVTLICPREISPLYQTTFYWIRFVSGNWPEILRETFNFETDVVTKVPHITVKLEEATFLLHIYGAKRSDAGLYYCVKVEQPDMKFTTGIFLKVKGPEPDITAVIQELSSDPISPGDPKTLRCSVLSDSKKKACSADHGVSWFRSGSDRSHPSLIYVHGNSSEECGISPEADSLKRCVYNFSKKIISSDPGTYYCAVATCGQILFGNGTKLGDEDVWNQQTSKIILMLSVALTVSLAGIACLIYTIKKKSCRCCYDAAANSADRRNKQRGDHTLVYSAPTFTKRKIGKPERRNEREAPEDTIYTAVKTFGTNNKTSDL